LYDPGLTTFLEGLIILFVELVEVIGNSGLQLISLLQKLCPHSC
jgi:hypothetical protein